MKTFDDNCGNDEGGGTFSAQEAVKEGGEAKESNEHNPRYKQWVLQLVIVVIKIMMMVKMTMTLMMMSPQCHSETRQR